jgi:hypothetical protein
MKFKPGLLRGLFSAPPGDCRRKPAPGPRWRRRAAPPPLPVSGLALLRFFLLLCLVWAGAGARSEEASRPLVFGVNRVGGSEVLHDPPDYDEDLYRTIREAGGTCVRLVASPRDIERGRGQREWSHFDRDLSLAIRYGQEPIICIVNTPAWASPTGEGTHLYPYQAKLLGEFSSFCEDLAARTKGKARLFQLWNEPNGCGWHFEDGFNHADEYLPVLAACREGLQKSNPEAILSIGGLDDAEGHAPIFLGKLYDEMKKRPAGTRSPFDAVSDHPYSETIPAMRAKLDALRKILEANGDGAKPFWITEYGWHTGATSPEEQAKKLAAALEAFSSDSWKDLRAAVYLSIADFEMTEDGFGLTDANLRPRPAFYAFQGAPRFGACPAFRIESSFPSAGTLRIAWRTARPSRGIVRIEHFSDKGVSGEGASGPTEARESPEGAEHQVAFDGIAPDQALRFTIETIRQEGASKKSITSAPHEVRSPGAQVCGGGFEEGFFGGIGKGWRIEGRGFCTDATLLPEGTAAEGRHAQAVFAEGVHGHGNFDSTLSAVVAATPGKELRVSYSWAALERKTLTEVKARAGFDPTGGVDPTKIQWEAWGDPGPRWQKRTLIIQPENTVVEILFQCKLVGSLRKGSAAFLLDAVRVEGEGRAEDRAPGDGGGGAKR